MHDFDELMTPPAPAPTPANFTPDFDAAMTPKKRGRPPAPPKIQKQPPHNDPSINNIYIYKEPNLNNPITPVNLLSDNQDDSISGKDILTRQELAFLEIYFNSPHQKGKAKATIDNSMIRAGYGDLSQNMRYLIAKKTFGKYERAAGGAAKIFQDLGYGKIQVAEGIIFKAEHAQSETVSLNALALAAKCQGMTEEKEAVGQGINIIIHTAPPPAGAATDPGTAQPPFVVIGAAPGTGTGTPAPSTRKPLQITR